MSPDRITKIVPRPKPVSIGGGVFSIWEFTLSDLAVLQSFLDDEWPDPLDAIDEALLNPEMTPEQRDDILFAAHARADEGPPIDGSEEAAKRYTTNEGVMSFLVVALRHPSKRCEPFTKQEVEEVADVFSRMKATEYMKLRRACYGTSTLKTITRLIMGSEPPGEGEGTWAEAIDEVATNKVWTYQYVYSLTITEFVNARRGGKPVDDGTAKVMNPDQAERYEAYLSRTYNGAVHHG